VALPEHLDPRLIDTWAFDVLAMSREEARAYVLMMFGSMGLLRLDEGGPDDVPEAGKASLDADTAASEGFCSPKTLWNFLERLEGGYRRNAYHNFQHAVDVTHTVYRYAVLTEPRTHVTQTEKFALMVAALAHDLDHPGVSNAFLVNTRDPLATVYNDSSVLENAHVAALYNLIRTRQMREGAGSGDERDDAATPPSAEDEANVFALLDDDLYREVRATIIAAVLHTDMSHHFKMVSQMEVFHELHSEGIKANTRRVRRGVMVDCIYQKEDDRRFILCVLLHAADIGNPVKPLKTYRKWANRVLSEFFAQGDLEKEKGMPVSAMMDAAATNAAMSQINFMEFVVAPLYANFTRLFPEARELVTHLIENRVHFQRALERELDGEESPDEPGIGSRAGLERVPAAERFFAESGGARAARAGAGKSSAEREADKHATRARFKALVEKHDFKARLMSASFDSFDSERDVTCEGNDFAERAAFEALMREAPRNAKLARLPPSPRADGSPNALSGFGPNATGSRRTLLAATAAAVRDAALAAGASAKKLRRPSGKADAITRSPPRAT
jgi:cAMP-specific phosphodiesterase 4